MNRRIYNYKQFINESYGLNPIPTYEECVEMCASPDSPFYEAKREVMGYKVSMFNYRIAQWLDFETPLKEKPGIKAYEMRGLTFVFNKDGSLFERYVLLEKFFNLNQVPSTMYSVVKNYKIKHVNIKEDGSIASFIKLPNGLVVGKSKIGFDNEQAEGINRIYETSECVKEFVNWCLDKDIVPIFEYVAPHNRIVLRYSDEELILLRLRDNKTGKHIEIKEHLDKLGSIKIAPFDDEKTLDDLIELSETEADKEGWIVTAKDEHGRDFFYKIKTKWYNNLHSVYTTDLYHEDKLIDLIVNEKIDDIIGELQEDDHLRKKVDEIITIIKRCINEKMHRIQKLHEEYEKNNSIKDFTIRYRNDKDFPETIRYIRSNESLEDLAKEWILRKTNKLEKARKFIENNKPTKSGI